MKTFNINDLVFLLPVVLLATVLLILWFGFRGKYRSRAKAILLSLVTAAEAKYGGGTGKLKFAYVSERLYLLMPKLFRILFTVQTVDAWIEDAVAKMKKSLAESNGDINGR